MKLSRTQKIIRNFLLTALLLLIRWFLGGMDPVTPSQALRWEALEWGLMDEPQILYQAKGERNCRYLVFAADGKLCVGRTSWGLLESYANIGLIRQAQEVTILRQTNVDMTDSIPAIYTVADIPGAVEVELEVHMEGVVNKTAAKQATPWAGDYTCTAVPNENGVSAFFLEQKETDNSAEERMLEDLIMALDGYAIPNRTYEIKLTFRGEGGDTIKTCTRSYENKAWSDLKEEEP